MPSARTNPPKPSRPSPIVGSPRLSTASPAPATGATWPATPNRIDNPIDVFGKAFLGMTIACARCHDHKFDAISTKDYYSLAGYLQSSRMDRAFLDDPEPRRKSLKQMEALASQLQGPGRRAAA